MAYVIALGCAFVTGLLAFEITAINMKMTDIHRPPNWSELQLRRTNYRDIQGVTIVLSVAFFVYSMVD